MKTCIIIAGPTAVGKTAIAIDLARFLSTEIISADSRQCYQELNIGVAKPTLNDLATVQHHFINSHSIEEDVSAATFEQFALHAIAGIFEKHDVAVMVGGTGLYLQAFAHGLDEIPNVPLDIKKKIADQYAIGGMQWLQYEIEQQDPAYFASGELLNPQRMLRALEVKIASGKSIRDFQSRQKKERPFRIIKIGLQLPRDVLYIRINQRVDEMIAAGLLDEAKQLFMYRNLNALQTVGYRELFDHFDGTISLNRAIELIKQHTRHYAKRQMTWFKRDPEFRWVELNDGADAVQTILKAV